MSIRLWLAMLPLLLLGLAGGLWAQTPKNAEVAATRKEAESAPADLFWASLRELCGQAFAGRLIESVPPDAAFEGKPMVMHVRECGDSTIRIPFHLGENRSRTWVVSRTESGLRLKHDHRHEDGSEDKVTQYGGDSRPSGTATKQEFPADALTGKLLPVSATNVWTLEIEPGAKFTYALQREGRKFRVEFDLKNPIPPPLPPWGATE